MRYVLIQSTDGSLEQYEDEEDITITWDGEKKREISLMFMIS